MFSNFGWGEIAVILVIGLFVFGPERLPKVISDGARMLRQLRAQASSITDDIKAELDPHLDELRGLDPRDALGSDPDRPDRRRDGSRPGSVPVAPQPTRLAAGDVPPYDPDAT